MGGLIYFRAFRTRGVFTKWSSFRKEIVRSMNDKVLPSAEIACRGRVSGWYRQPGFEKRVEITQRGIFAYCTPVGPGSENWARVSRGVPGHWISVRKQHTFRGVGKYKPALRLNRYRPSTTPDNTFGFTPFRIPPTGYRQVVWWPGIRPRLFEEHIAVHLQPRYRSMMENAARSGVRRMIREGD